MKILKFCLSEGQDPKQLVRDEQSGTDISLLSVAARNGSAECLKELLSIPGIDVNLANKNNFTPLVFAVTFGNAECVELLLSRDDVVTDTVALDSCIVKRAFRSGDYDTMNIIVHSPKFKITLSNLKSYLYEAEYYTDVDTIKYIEEIMPNYE